MTIPSFVTTTLPLTPTTSFNCFRILRMSLLPVPGEVPADEVLEQLPDPLGAQRVRVVQRDRQPAHPRNGHVAAGAFDLGAHEGAGVHAAAGLVRDVADAGDELGELRAGQAP